MRQSHKATTLLVDGSMRYFIIERTTSKSFDTFHLNSVYHMMTNKHITKSIEHTTKILAHTHTLNTEHSKGIHYGPLANRSTLCLAMIDINPCDPNTSTKGVSLSDWFFCLSAWPVPACSERSECKALTLERTLRGIQRCWVNRFCDFVLYLTNTVG